MIEFVLSLFCLIVSFKFSSKKMKILYYVQAILSFFEFLLVLFVLPNAIFKLQGTSGQISRMIKSLQVLVLSTNSLNFSLIEVIMFAILFMTVLSIANILEYIQIFIKEQSEITTTLHKDIQLTSLEEPQKKEKIYLVLCRLIS